MSNLVITVLLLIAGIFEFVLEADTCVYVVESRRVMEQRDVKLNTQQTEGDACEIPESLKDRWMLVNRPRERLRIRGNVSMIVKYGKTKHQYSCLESKGHTFLLATTQNIGSKQGVLCILFTQVNNDPKAEYRIVRLNGHGAEHHILGPQLLPQYLNSYPTLNDTCVLAGGVRDYSAYIRRTERRCNFPEEIIRSWNYTYRAAKDVSFAEKTFTLTLMSGEKVRFDCSRNDGDVYILRSTGYTDPIYDGIMCLNITKLDEDPHYKYELSRLNSGDHLDGMVKLYPVGKPVSVLEDCDWIDSPARPQYIY
ncbi:hypothetical protein ACF0H5_008727 [Mactra antiquata]